MGRGSDRARSRWLTSEQEYVCSENARDFKRAFPTLGYGSQTSECSFKILRLRWLTLAVLNAGMERPDKCIPLSYTPMWKWGGRRRGEERRLDFGSFGTHSRCAAGGARVDSPRGRSTPARWSRWGRRSCSGTGSGDTCGQGTSWRGHRESRALHSPGLSHHPAAHAHH